MNKGMKSLSSALAEDLRLIMPLVALGAPPPSTIDAYPEYHQLADLLASLHDNPELDQMSPPELRALKTLQITLGKCTQMEPSMARKHIMAVWQGAAEQAVLKTSIGPIAHNIYKKLTAGDKG